MADNYNIVMDLIDNASPAIDKVADKLKETAEASGKWGKAAAIGIGAIVAAAGAAYAAMESISKAAESAIMTLSQLGEQAKTVGLGVKEYQIFINTLGQVGVSADKAHGALVNMTERIGEARLGSGEMFEALKRLDIPLENANGSWRTASEIIADIIQSISDANDQSDRLRIAAQTGGDAFREVIGNISDAPELLAKAAANAKENVIITQELVDSMREARLELENYNQKTRDAKLISDASLVPLMQMWQDVKNAISQSTQGLFQFFGLLSDPTPAQSLAKTSIALDAAQRRLDRARANSDKPWWHLGRASATDIAIAATEVKKLTAEVQKYKDELDNIDSTAAPTQLDKALGLMNARRAELQKWDAQRRKDLEKVDALELSSTRATQDAKVALIQNANKQIDAETALRVTRLREDSKRQLDNLTMSETQRLRIEADIEERIVAIQSLANQKKLENNRKANDEVIKQNKKLVDTLNAIHNQTIDLQRANTSLITTGRESNSEIEYLQELRKAYEEYSDAKKYASERDAINTALQLKRDASIALQQTRDDNTIKEQIRELVRQTEVINALTKEERMLLEVRYAMEDLRKQVENPNEALLTQYREALINKNKAQETVEEAKKNAAEIEAIYANAAQSIQGAFSDFFFDVMQGNMTNLADSFKKTIDRMVAELLAANLFKMVGGMGTGVAGESNLSGMFASFFGGLQGRAKGGPTRAGTPYWVGEQGPEIIIPSVSSTVIPADLSSSIANGGNQAQAAPSLTTININAIDSRSFMETLESNDRDLVNLITETTQRYGMGN